eukprot:scaffold625_cov324-Pavlova_lutheri.AAC.43
MGLLARHDARGVARIWAAQHAKEEERGRVGTHIDAKSYGKFVERAKEAPLFVLPLAKPEGYLTVVLQVQLPRVLFTTLEEYRTHTTSSKAHLAITHYTELAADKGIVLVRGDVLQKSDVNIFEAKALLKHTYDFYLDPRKYETCSWSLDSGNECPLQTQQVLKERGLDMARGEWTASDLQRPSSRCDSCNEREIFSRAESAGTVQVFHVHHSDVTLRKADGTFPVSARVPAPLWTAVGSTRFTYLRSRGQPRSSPGRSSSFLRSPAGMDAPSGSDFAPYALDLLRGLLQFFLQLRRVFVARSALRSFRRFLLRTTSVPFASRSLHPLLQAALLRRTCWPAV